MWSKTAELRCKDARNVLDLQPPFIKTVEEEIQDGVSDLPCANNFVFECFCHEPAVSLVFLQVNPDRHVSRCHG